MTFAVTVENPLPRSIVAISEESAAKLSAMLTQCDAFRAIGNVHDYKCADAVASEVVKAMKEIEAERKRLKRPILDLGEALDSAAGEALAPLAMAKARLGVLLLNFQTAENNRRAEEKRKAEEARRIAEEAQRKAQAEARAQAEEMERLRREAEAKEVEAWPWEEPAAVVVPEPVPMPEPVAIPIVRQMEYAPIKSAAVTRKTIKRLVITDPALVPREVAGVPLWIIDEAAGAKLLKAGIAVPGMALEESETIAAKG